VPVQSNFLAFQNSIKTGPGDITADIREARLKRVEKYK